MGNQACCEGNPGGGHEVERFPTSIPLELIKDEDKSAKQRKLIKFTSSLPISEGLMEFLTVIFGMIDESKIILLCLVNDDIDQDGLDALQIFQKRFEAQLYGISVHHLAAHHPSKGYPAYLSILSWNSVRVMSFKNNGLDDDDCAVMKRLLEANSTMTALMLDFNRITAKGCADLIEFVAKKMPSVLVVSLTYNKINDAAIGYLQATISSNHGLGSLQSIRLRFNQLTEQSKQIFEKYVQSKRLLCKIEL